MEIMNVYWGKSKTLYYRKIKRQLEMGQESSQVSRDKISSQQSKEIGVKFKLPDALCSYQVTFLHDPDATLRNILTTMTNK